MLSFELWEKLLYPHILIDFSLKVTYKGPVNLSYPLRNILNSECSSISLTSYVIASYYMTVCVELTIIELQPGIAGNNYGPS